MANIINAKDRFNLEPEFDGCIYTTDENGSIGVRSITLDMEIYQDENGYRLTSNGDIKERKELAEFLWVAAILLDSEERYKPDADMAGHNY